MIKVMVKHMKTLDKPDSPLYNKLIEKIKEEYRANPTERNMTIIMPRDELEEIVDKDNFQESFEAECQKLMYVRIESETSIAALCNTLSWNGKELSIEVSRFVIPFLAEAKLI